MKKITLLLFFIGIATKGFSQEIYSEDFSSGDISAWTLYDVNQVADDDWFLTDESNWAQPFGYYTDNFLASFSWNGQDYSPDNIAVSPLISIPAVATDTELSFLVGSGNDTTYYAEHYAVYVTTSNAQAAILAATPVLEETLPSAGYNTKTVDLSAFAGMDVYISFRHFNTTGQWVLVVDEVEVTSQILNVEEFSSNSISHFYNATTNELVLKSSAKAFTSVAIYSILGQQVVRKNLSQNTETINVSHLSKGIYIAKVVIDGKEQTIKFVKQ